jgi:hypothetical protein
MRCGDRRNENSFERIFLASGVTVDATASRKDLPKKRPGDERRKTGGQMSARGRLTCRDAMLCLRRSHWVFCLALYISSLAPAPGEALAHPGLAYVVSPPPATRQMMPNYLPKLPPESTARVPRVSAHSAPRLRAGCRSCRLRPRHIRRCAHCRHGVENPSASRRHHRAGHRAHHHHGHFGQHQRHVPRHHKRALNDRSRSAPRRSQSMLCSLAPCRNAMDEVRRCLRTEIFY